jgi:hypothetical protein
MSWPGQLISKSTQKVINFDEADELLDFQAAIRMLKNIPALAGKIATDWRELDKPVRSEIPSNIRAGMKAVGELGEEVAGKEPNLRKIFELVKEAIEHLATDLKKEKVEEGLGELAQMAEEDHEVQMARADLYKIAKYAIKLHEIMKGVSEKQGLKGWQQAKITKASDYISSVYHSLDYETKFNKSNFDMDSAKLGESSDDEPFYKSSGTPADWFLQDIKKGDPARLAKMFPVKLKHQGKVGRVVKIREDEVTLEMPDGERVVYRARYISPGKADKKESANPYKKGLSSQLQEAVKKVKK